MSPYREQLARIKQKLPLARQADREVQVFGANGHQYRLKGPVALAEVVAFEQQYGLVLPEDYRLFLLEVGPGPGPFYGLYPLGSHVNELIDQPHVYLRQPATIFPGMSDEAWTTLNRPIEDHEDLDDEAYERELNRLYAGLLPLGTQGCSAYHVLVVSGPHKGRVVNLDAERYRPQFAYEPNFLDWYERWMDEIINGGLLNGSLGWFGYCRGGSDTDLMSNYIATEDASLKVEYLNGLSKLKAATPLTLAILTRECHASSLELRQLALHYLTKFDYLGARPLLKSAWPAEPLLVYKLLFWFAKPHADDWHAELRRTLADTAIDAQLFQFATYVLGACRQDLTVLIQPFAQHPNEQIRRQALHILQSAPNKPLTKSTFGFLSRLFPK